MSAPPQAPTRVDAPLPTRLVRLIRSVVDRALLAPVRAGRLADTGWPPGLRAVVDAGTALYLVVLGGILAAGWLRETDAMMVTRPDQTVPALVFALVLAVMSFALAALFTAALHLRWWWKVLAWLAVTTALWQPLFLDRLFTQGAAAVHWTAWAVLGVPVALALLLIVRARSRFAAWEFPVALVLIGHAVVFTVALRPVNVLDGSGDERLSRLIPVIDVLFTLATPIALMAGAALAELVLSIGVWTTTGIAEQFGRRRRYRTVLLVLVGGLVLWRFVAWALLFDREGVLWTDLAASTLVALVTLPAIGLAGWAADRVAGDLDVRADPDDVPDVWRRVAPVLGFTLGAMIAGPILLGQALRAAGQLGAGQTVYLLFDSHFEFLLLAASVVLAVLAARQARRGLRLTAMALAAASAYTAADQVALLLGLSTDATGIQVVAVLGSLACLIGLAVQRRLEPGRLLAVVLVLLLTVAWDYRQILGEPLAEVLAISGVSTTLVAGLIWKLLTDHAHTRDGSPAAGVPARVLLALANAMLGVGLVLMLAGSGGHYPISLTGRENLGDGLIGGSLYALTVFIGLSLAVSGTRRRYTQGVGQLQ